MQELEGTLGSSSPASPFPRMDYRCENEPRWGRALLQASQVDHGRVHEWKPGVLTHTECSVHLTQRDANRRLPAHPPSKMAAPHDHSSALDDGSRHSRFFQVTSDPGHINQVGPEKLNHFSLRI